MSTPEPLPLFQFAPVFREYLWGGRRLGSVLGKPIGDGETYAESWEVVDHGQDQSVVAGGPFDGTTLSQLVKDHGLALLGEKWHQKISDASLPDHLQGRFPLLIKWLDSQKDLSIQVHPNDQQAALLNPPDLGKTEAWYIADALPGAKVYAGLKSGVTQDDFAAALSENRIVEVLHSFEPEIGDCLFIPAGTVHALGAGLLVAEVQQASNTTYRIYDWDRVGADGKPRDLHIEQSIQVTNYQAGPVQPQNEAASQLQSIHPSGNNEANALVDCQYFSIDRIQIDRPFKLPDQQCCILIGLEGSAKVVTQTAKQNQAMSLNLGQTVLVPHHHPKTKIIPAGAASILIARLP